jgi:FlaA1/EpsC-like NDP-sugar epimerase
MKNKVIACTGGSGFLGESLIKRLLTHKPKEIRILGRNEGQLIKMKEKFPSVVIYTGDIADAWTARKFLKGADIVFHLAGFKHVGLAEKEVYQCIRTNIIGSMNVIRASYIYKPELVLAISTDKASQVNGVYGASKMLMERLWLEAEIINDKTKYRVVRYGNVLFSTGSVLCKWKKLMKEKEVCYITDLDATRFFWTREQAVDHIFECIKKTDNADPYIPKMKAMRMGDLWEAMDEKYDGGHNLFTIGLQPGENLHETMDGKVFSNEVEQYTIREILKLI